MFNLLRRSKNKKSKNKCAEDTADDAEALNSSSANQQHYGTRTTAGGVTERYRQFSELESEVGLPTIGAAIKATLSNTRAPIEELEDLRDLDEDDEDEKQATAYGQFNNTNDDRIYFDRCTDRLWEKEKVNLAKTAANFTAVVPAAVAITARTKNSKSNSAIKPNKKAAFAFSQQDVDSINKLVAVAALDAGDGDGRESSQNELAEWQGHVSPIGNRKIIDKTIKRSESEIEQFKYSAISPTSTASTTSTAARSSKSNQFNTEDAERSVCDPTTNGNNNSRSTADTVINEVRYRNLGNSQQSVKKKSSEAKRQSRLSLTSLGLNLTSGKSKSAAETTTTDVPSSRPVVVKRSDLERQSIRRSFFHNNKSKSIDSDQAVIECNESKSRPNSNLFYRETGEVDRKLNPLQKSREFLSEIFMARGRNHNRNRNQPQQPHQQIQQQHEPQQSHTTKAPQEPCKYAAVSSDSHIHHNNNNRNEPATAAIAMNVNQHGNANNVTNWSQHSTHLETISDPSSVSTNSYQMTTSNNSPKNFSHQIEVAKEEHQQQQQQKRSNSAEHARGERGNSSVRSLSEGPTQSAGVRSAKETMCENEDDDRQQEPQQQPSVPLNNADDDVRCFIHAPSIERNGVITADITTTANNEEEDQQREDQEVADHHNKHGNQIRTGEHETLIDGAGNRESGNAKRQLNELTECDRDSLLHSANVKSNERDACEWSPLSALTSSSAVLMGQTNAKPETPSSTRSSTPREFRVSIIPEAEASEGGGGVDKPTVIVPKITVVDYSDGDGSGSSGDGSPVEQEVFYDFENGKHNKRDSDSGVNITAIEEFDDIVEEHENDDGIEDDDDEVFQDLIPATVQQNKWPLSHAQMRHSHAKLENVPEQEEEDEEEAMEEEEDEEEEENNDAGNADERHFDNELERNHFDSPERNPLKSTNTSDSNLSTSFPDSGIGDSQTSSLSPTAKHLLGGGGVGFFANGETTTSSMRSANAAAHRLPFVRDGNSTDCDETLMQCDDLEFVAEVEAANPNERLVCIESISLPDVVVESTTGNSLGSNSSGSSAAAAAAAAADHQIININGATGNTMGNVHFIPIHVEGDKRRSVDDSVIGSGGKSFAHMNGHHHSKPTIEIIEDASETHANRSNGFKIDDGTADKLKRELVDQKSRFNFQLEAAQKNVHNLQTKVEEMQGKIDTMEQELSAKAWNVERLQGELNAAHKDDDFVRKKLKLLEDEKTNLRHKYSENEDEFKNKYEELEMQYKELDEKYKQTQSLASNLQTQLAAAQSEAEAWRDEVDKIRTELEDQIRILRNALENSEAERKICEDKWQKEFEMLRTQNLDREETLMTDCEWQMRQMQKSCKEKYDKSEHGRNEALEKAEMLENELEERQQELDDLKVYAAQVNSLRGVVSEQELSIESLMTQIENMKAELKAANENLEEQIEAVKMIKYQCDNALYDKERQVIYRIDEVRNEAAAFWENKLYTEMTRLKNELESVYVDERREALDKLQAEHIEELRALTTRYTANEEELRIELADLQERFDSKNEEFLELREKSDNALLQTRMHLDKADREYQNAMFREEERREILEESLRKEFEDEKLEMEEKFRERLGQVKDEFAKELQLSSQEMAEQHKKNFEQQKARLQAEKDEALQDLADRHRKKLAAAEYQIRDIELRHQRDLTDLKAAYDAEKAALDKRDISNANEIEQLHRKCRCLTNLFEEMRMRYERRDPRAEDLREINELRSRCESQERDLYVLTDRLREMQIQMAEMQQNGENQSTKKSGGSKAIKKPPPKTIPTNCDVIYEENEERVEEDEEDEEEEEEEEDDEEEEDNATEEKPQLNGKDININLDLIKEDESHMISAV